MKSRWKPITLGIAILLLIGVLYWHFIPTQTPPEGISQTPVPEIPQALRYPKATGSSSDINTLLLNETDVDNGIFTSELGDEKTIQSDTQEIHNLDHAYDETQL